MVSVGVCMSEWFEVLIFPAFCIAMIYFIGRQFNLWGKVQGFLGSHGGINFRGMLEGLKNISFEGIGDLFRGWFT